MNSIFALPKELVLSSIKSHFPCRDQQIQALSTLLAIRGAPSRNIVLYGLHASGKSAITKALLAELSSASTTANGPTDDNHSNEPEDELRYAIIKSAECITGRHLLEQTLSGVARAIDWRGGLSGCQNAAHLVVEIGKMLEQWTERDDESGKRRMVLVFDGIGTQRDIPTTLLPALARMGEIIPSLTTIYILTSPRPSFLHLPGIPHIHFPSYTKAELLNILSLTTPSPSLPTGLVETKSVWTKFLPAVYDTLTKHSGRDILSFRTTSLILWPKFIQPVLDGSHSATPFSRLLLANRSLLQNDNILIPSITTPKPASATLATTQRPQALAVQLPFYTRLLLLASYLASFNPPRTDTTHFMRSALARRRKKGGGTALARKSTSKHRKISRKLLGAQTFVLERMLAIFACLREDASNASRRRAERRNGGDEVAGSADIMTAIATLASLRLLIKMGPANAGDVMDGGCKYRVAVGWEVVRGVGRSVGVEVEDYVAE